MTQGRGLIEPNGWAIDKWKAASSQRSGRDDQREQANENQSMTAAEKSNGQIMAQNSNNS